MTADSQPQTLVTQEMLDRKGVWEQEDTSYPISDSDIRRWSIAAYWPETPPREFWDAEFARTTTAGGIVAPPDFNPFAWPPVREVPEDRRSATAQGVGQRRMNGGQVDTFGVPMRPGDVIRTRTRLTHWEERETRLGHTMFMYEETEWRNQRDEVVKTRVKTRIRF